jgi:ribosomal protein S18 acetylase RimI-like enzyme
MKVRLYKKEDTKELVFLYNKFNTSKLTTGEFLKLIKATKSRDYILCGLIEKRVVGYLIIKIDMDIEYAGMRSEVTDFYVQPKFRRQGLGRALLGKAKKLAKQKDCKTLTLLTDDDGSIAQKLYRDFGFKPVKGARLFQKKI